MRTVVVSPIFPRITLYDISVEIHAGCATANHAATVVGNSNDNWRPPANEEFMSRATGCSIRTPEFLPHATLSAKRAFLTQGPEGLSGLWMLKAHLRISSRVAGGPPSRSSRPLALGSCAPHACTPCSSQVSFSWQPQLS
jgi:hypothetical protein